MKNRKVNNYRVTYRQKKPSKQMNKLIAKATKEMENETARQYILVHASMTLALYRFWNFKTERINNLYKECEKIWDECGNDKSMSMIRKCDEECDIELTNYEGVSYRDISWLNDSTDNKPLNDFEFYTFRVNQKKWVKAQMLASVCLTVHRAENWSFNRLSKLMLKMEDVMAEFDYNEDEIVKAAHDETGSEWISVDYDVKVVS